MNIKLTTLPILEQWDCHHCTACCRETTIPLSPEDVKRLRDQRWEEHPDFRGIDIMRGGSRRSSMPVLAHVEDGRCVFLTDAGRCRIHEDFGADAKPFVCRLFPLQVVATDRGASLTVRRSCPSAAADRGRPLTAHVQDMKRLLRDGGSGISSPSSAPPISRGIRRGWDDFHLAAAAIQRLITDARWPMVRRLIHGLQFCSLLEECQWKRVEAKATEDLIEVLEHSAPNNIGGLFQDRKPPPRSIARLFRRLGAHFIQCVPGGRPIRTWRDRWRNARLSGQLARVNSQYPALHPHFPAIDADQLERALGPLSEEVLRPLNRFFESHASSMQYALFDAQAPLNASFRRLAFTYPTALWMLRWLCVDRVPTAQDMVTIVVGLERGYVLPALGTASNFMSGSGDLERLIAWYSR